MNTPSCRAVVLAAGKSTRFKTPKSKLLFDICGQAMLLYPLNVLNALKIPTSLVLGYQADEIIELIKKEKIDAITPVIQKEQLGTGHAVAITKDTWDSDEILILYGDMPLLTQEIVEELLAEHREKQATISFMTAMVLDPRAYGRVIEKDGKYEVVEAKDCTEEQKHVNCINAGVYVMNRSFLETHIPNIEKSAVTGEIYLPGLIKTACDLGMVVHAMPVPFDYVRGVNTLEELWGVEQIKRSEFIKHFMNNGVRFELAQGIHVDKDVDIQPGSFVGTGVHLQGKTKIGKNCTIEAFCVIKDTVIGDNTTILSHTVIHNSKIGNHVNVGPFANLRSNTILDDNVVVGNFIEIKNSHLGANTIAKHTAYLCDTTIGSNVNVCAGTITCTYEGSHNKQTQTIIQDNAFVGSNNILIAPITIGKGAITAAGSVLTNDVPCNALAVARSKQVNKEGYAHKVKLDGEVIEKGHIEKSDLFDDHHDVAHTQFRGAIKTDPDHKNHIK